MRRLKPAATYPPLNGFLKKKVVAHLGVENM